MSFSKTQKLFVVLLGLLLVLSITNASFPVNSFSKETDKAAESALKVPLDNEDVDILYPTVLLNEGSSHENKEVFMRYVSNIPKFDKNPIPHTQQYTNTSNQPVLTKENSTPATVANTIYQSYSIPQSLKLNDGIMSNICHSNELIYDSLVQSTYSVSNSVYSVHSIKNKAGFYNVGFLPQSGQNLLSFSYEDANLLMSPSKTISVAGKVYKNSICYEGIYPNIDLRYIAEDSRLKEDIIIQKFSSKSDFNFQLSVNNTVYEMMPNGEIKFSSIGSGRPLFYMAKPFAIDNNGNRCDLVKLSLSNNGQLVLSVDPDWLAKAVYPVVIDPTIYLADAIFNRSSTAYKQDGTQVITNQPRYENGKFGQAIMIEEGTTNLLTKNSFETDTYEWVLSGAASRSNGASYVGSYSLALTNPTIPQHSYNIINGISPSTTYTISFYAKNVNGLSARIDISELDYFGAIVAMDTNVIYIPNDVSNVWTRYSKTVTTNSRTAKFEIRVICGEGGTQTGVCYLDCFQVEQKGYLTSFADSTRAAETLTIPSTVFTKNNWSVEYTYTPQTADNKGVVATWGLSCENGSWYRIIQYSSGWIQASVCVGGVEKGISGDPGMALSAKKPYTVCFTGDGSYLRLYVNGAQIGTAAAYTEPISALNANMFIGTDSSGNLICNGLIDDLRISNRARTATEIQAAYISGLPVPIDGATTCKMGFEGNLQIDVYAIFNRSSTAYKQDGTQVIANQPRYEAGKFGQAIMIEEGTTNLLTNNSFEIDTSGWVLSGAASRSNGASYVGSHSLALTNPTIPQQSYNIINGISPSTTYTISLCVKNVNGLSARIDIAELDYFGAIVIWDTNDIFIPNDVSNVWTRYSKTVTTNSRTAKFDIRVICGEGGTQTGVCYLDCFQVEKKGYLTSFADSTRATETMTILTAGVINANQGSIEVSAYIDPAGVHSVNNRNWSMIFAMADIQGSPYQERNQISIRRSPNSTNWGVWFSNASGGGSVVGLGNITTAGWYNFGVTWQTGVGGYGYLNGVKKGSVVANHLPSAITAPIAYVGSWTGSIFQHNQLIDDLRISSRLRTATEILAAYQGNQPLPMDIDTTCELKFDDYPEDPNFVYEYHDDNRLNKIIEKGVPIFEFIYDGNGNLLSKRKLNM